MLALAQLESEEKADNCQGCGGRLSETTAVDEWGRPVHRYEAPPPHRCWRCNEVLKRQEQYKDTPRPQALQFSVREETRAVD